MAGHSMRGVSGDSLLSKGSGLACVKCQGKAQPSTPSKGGRCSRVAGYDVIRGFTIISMMAFHFCYDLVYLQGVAIPWFAPPLQDVWRASISWVFLLIAGIMSSKSRNNARRAVRYLLFALAVWGVTSVVAVDTPISFGIIYCMGASTLCAYGLQRAKISKLSLWTLMMCCLLAFLLFVACLEVPRGAFGFGAFGGPSVPVPRALYKTQWLSWLGFPGPGFSSGDYYPPLPYTLMFLSGTFLGEVLRKTGEPAFLARLSCRPLAFVGRHPLVFYAAHQPVLLALSFLF